MSGYIYTQATGELAATLQGTDAAALVAAKAALGSGGQMQIGPGAEALVLGAGWTNISLARVTNNGIMALSRFHMADGDDPTKLFSWLMSAVSTGTTRTVTMPNYSGFMVLPVDLGASGQFLRSSGAGVQPTWAAVPSPTNALLDGVNHTDTVAQAVLRGALVVGNSTPKWDRLAIGGANTVLFSNGTDPSWATVASLTALLQHDLLLHLKPFAVTNCNWAAGSTTITHAASGFANVKVGDFVHIGDNASGTTTGGRVTVWNNAGDIVVSRSNATGAGFVNQTFIFQPGDHWDDSLVADSLATGAGLVMSQSPGSYTTTGGGTYQELRGPYRWMPDASGSIDSDFDVRGSRSTTTLSGFCIRRQGTTNRAYFYSEPLTGSHVYSLPNLDGVLVLTSNAQNITDKLMQGNNQFYMQATAGAGNGCWMVDPTTTGKTLYFDLTGLTNPSARIQKQPDYDGTSHVWGAVTTLTGATPSVAGGNVFKVSNGGATNMTNLTNSVDGMTVTLLFTNGNTTIKDTSTTGSFEVRGSGDYTPAANEVLTFVRVNADSKWYEVSRSAD